MHRRRPILVALALALGLLAPAVRAKDSFKDWVSGPVRYIALKEELQSFRKLKEPAKQAVYIERFWARRDPTPETLTNEYRQLFWERVQQANTNFLDSSKPGWKTDRGKIHILYGAPTQIEEELDLATQVDSTAGRGLIRWIYEGRPEQRRDLNAITVVAFVRNVSGEFRVSYDPVLTSVFFDALAIKEQSHRAMERFIDVFGAPAKSELSVMLDLGKMQEVPPASRILLERVETIESYTTHTVGADVARYDPPDEAGVLVVLTVDLGHVEKGNPASIMARFVDTEAPSAQPTMLGEDSFMGVEIDGQRVAQGRVLLDPGRYNLTLLVIDGLTAATGVHRETVLAFSGDGELRLSDLQLADEIEPLPYATLASHSEPYLLGPYRVVPRVPRPYVAGQSVRLFYEIYGGVMPYQVSYQLEGQELDGRWVQLGQPSEGSQTGAAQAWELPTSTAWPAGAYRVRVRVEDAEGKRVSDHMAFEIDETVRASQ